MKKQILLSRDRLIDILKSMGVTIQSETSTDLLGYCPFHDNRDSPAFNMSLRAPYPWKCWNGSCDAKGNIVTLITGKGYTPNEAWKIIGSDLLDFDEFSQYIAEILEEEERHINSWADRDMSEFRASDEAAGWPARKYMKQRGFTDETLDYFQVGYSPKKHMVIVPVYDEVNRPIGVIGRAIEYKRYQYSTGLQRSKIIWNSNRVAKEHRDIVLTEGAFDAMYIYQAGVPNVGAVLGSAISPIQWRLLRNNYYGITCFFDNDKPGQSLTDSIFETVNDFQVYRVEYPDREIVEEDGDHHYPKDPGELYDFEIQEMMQNRKTKIEWLLEQPSGIIKVTP